MYHICHNINLVGVLLPQNFVSFHMNKPLVVVLYEYT